MVSLVLKEINGVRNYFRARSDNNPAHDTTLSKSFADSLMAMINVIKSLGPADATQLMKALNDDPYGEDQSRRLRDHIDTKLQHGHNGAKLDKIHTANKQLLKHWWNYFIAQECEVLRNPKSSFHKKMTIMVERSMSVGCVDPDEQTYKWGLATLLLMHYEDMPSPQEVYRKLQDLKQAFISERKVFLHEQLPQFPEHATDLPEHIFAEAYPGPDDPPTKIVLRGIHQVAAAIPLRSNSKLLNARGASRVDVHDAFVRAKTEPPASPSSSVKLPPQSSSPHDDPCEMALYNEYHQKLAELRRVKSLEQPLVNPVQPQPVSGLITLTIHRASDGVLKAETTMADATETPDARVKSEEPKEALRAKPEPVAIGIEDLDPYTRAAIESLDARNHKKKLGAADKRKSETLMKRPAAAELTKVEQPELEVEKPKLKKMKRPAAAEPSKNKAEPYVVPKAKIMASMPKLSKDGANPAPVLYKNGVIYTSRKAFAFRALAIRGDRYSETSKAWKGDKPTTESWASAVKSIDDKSK